MISTLHLLSSSGRSHLENLSSLERPFMDVLIGGVFWVILEDRNILAQDQQQPHTYHKWRENQHGMDILVPHIHPCNPTYLQEPKVEEIFHEFPSWRVTHFLWMIAWGWRLHMGMMIPNIFQIPCLKKASRPHTVVSMYIPLFQDESHLEFLPKAYFCT